MKLEDEKKVWELYNLGVTQIKIAEEIGVSRTTIGRFLKKYKEHPYEFKDELIGQRFGKLIVLELIDKPGDKQYKCKCDCGGEAIVFKYHLLSGHTKSCGCLRKQYKDLSNIQVGKLKVLFPLDKIKDGCKVWQCQCECGNLCEVNSTNLINKRTVSCGKCIVNDLTNQTFGKLTALYPLTDRKNGRIVWHCKCECGNECNVISSYLSSNGTQSCGCIKSRKEWEIKQYLNQYNIIYKTEYVFDDLYGKDKPLRFDFALFDIKNNLKCLIEYQGIQHYDINNPWYSELANNYDNKKREYCKLHNIPLYEITKDNNINAILSNILNERELI